VNPIEIDVISPAELALPAPEVAPALIGALLLRLTPELGRAPALLGRIVETEAYTEDDAASHSYRGPGGRAGVMFGPAGRAYVYLIYGMYSCLNVVCGAAGEGQAVLIRAVEPLYGIEQMRTNRLIARALARKGESARTRLAQRLTSRQAEIANGPGKVGAAFGVSVTRDYGKRLESSDLLLARQVEIGRGQEGGGEQSTVYSAFRREVATSARIGITRNVAPQWRFYETDNPAVSKPQR
jgi:DNA-3-methyladenine glycosylase